MTTNIIREAFDHNNICSRDAHGRIIENSFIGRHASNIQSTICIRKKDSQQIKCLNSGIWEAKNRQRTRTKQQIRKKKMVMAKYRLLRETNCRCRASTGRIRRTLFDCGIVWCGHMHSVGSRKQNDRICGLDARMNTVSRT